MIYFDEKYGVFVLYNESSRHYVYRYRKSSSVIRDLSAMQNSDLEINVRPNPFRGLIAISCPALAGSAISKKTVPIEIYSVNGKLVTKLKANNQLLKAGVTWNPHKQPPGIYLLKVQIDNQQYSKKLILQK